MTPENTLPRIVPTGVNPNWCAQEMADHRARIMSLEEEKMQVRINHEHMAEKLDKLQNWIMCTLGTALVGIVSQLLLHKQ